jgi:hypothetical protein
MSSVNTPSNNNNNNSHSNKHDLNPMTILTHWLRHTNYTLQYEEEVSSLLTRLKAMSKADHDWHSYDGRELDAPSYKLFQLKAMNPIQQQSNQCYYDYYYQQQQQQQQDNNNNNNNITSSPSLLLSLPIVRLDFTSQEAEQLEQQEHSLSSSSSNMMENSAEEATINDVMMMNQMMKSSSNNNNNNNQQKQSQQLTALKDALDNDYFVSLVARSNGKELHALWEIVEKL